MKSEWTPLLVVQTVLGLTSIVSVNMALVLLMFFEPPANSKDMLNIIIGAVLGVGFANVYGFFFGQKEQSAQAEQIAQATSSSLPPIEPPAKVTQTTTIEPGP